MKCVGQVVYPALLIFCALLPGSTFASSDPSNYNCGQWTSQKNCPMGSGICGWCNASYDPSNSGVCYNLKTEQCCAAYNECQEGYYQNSACLKNQTCCTPLRIGPPICCAPGMSCCQGLCYDPKVQSCCEEPYPNDFCGSPALCDLTSTCCGAYSSMCCQQGTFCCSDYHGNSYCFPNEYSVVCDPEGCQLACPTGSVCNGCSGPEGASCLFPNGTCAMPWY